jgi:hypothetical protein
MLLERPSLLTWRAPDASVLRLARVVRSSRGGNRREDSRMFGLGIIGTILLIVVILWLLGVF